MMGRALCWGSHEDKFEEPMECPIPHASIPHPVSAHQDEHMEVGDFSVLGRSWNLDTIHTVVQHFWMQRMLLDMAKTMKELRDGVRRLLEEKA